MLTSNNGWTKRKMLQWINWIQSCSFCCTNSMSHFCCWIFPWWVFHFFFLLCNICLRCRFWSIQIYFFYFRSDFWAGGVTTCYVPIHVSLTVYLFVSDMKRSRRIGCTELYCRLFALRAGSCGGCMTGGLRRDSVYVTGAMMRMRRELWRVSDRRPRDGVSVRGELCWWSEYLYVCEPWQSDYHRLCRNHETSVSG